MAAQSDNTLVLVNGLTRLIGSTDTIEFTGGMDNTPIGVHGASTLSATTGAFSSNVGIEGDLTVEGSIVSSGTTQAISQDQFTDLIHGNANVTTAKPGGLTLNQWPSNATDCGGAGGLATASFTAGSTGVSDAKITMGGAVAQVGARAGGAAAVITMSVLAANGDTLTIPKLATTDTVFTFVTGAPVGNQIQIGVDIPATTTNLIAAVNGLADYVCTANGLGFVLTAAADSLGSSMNGKDLSWTGTVNFTSTTASFAFAGGAGLSIGMLIEVAGADSTENDGLFEIVGITGTDIDVAGENTARSTQVPFTQSQFTAEADTNAKVRAVNLSVLAFSGGVLADEQGIAIPYGTLCTANMGEQLVAATSTPASAFDASYTSAAESTLQGAYNAGPDITLANGKDLDVIAFTSGGGGQGAAINLAANHSSAWIVGDGNNTSADLTLKTTQTGSQLYLNAETATGQSVDQDGASTIATNSLQVLGATGGVAVAGKAVLLQAGGAGITDRLAVESLNADVSMWSGLASGNGDGIRVIASDSGMYLEQGSSTNAEGFTISCASEASEKNGDGFDGFTIDAGSAGGNLMWGRGLAIAEAGQYASNAIGLVDFANQTNGDIINLNGIEYVFSAAGPENVITRTFYGTDEATCATSLARCINNSAGAMEFTAESPAGTPPGFPVGSSAVFLTAVDPGVTGNSITCAITVSDPAAYSGPGGGGIQATFAGGEGFTTEFKAISGNLDISSGGAATLLGKGGAELRAEGGSGVVLQGYSSGGPSVAVNGLGAAPGVAVFKVTGIGAAGDTVDLGDAAEWFEENFVAVNGAAGPGEWTVGATVIETTANLAASISNALQANNDLGGAGVVVQIYGGHFIQIQAGLGDAAISTAATGTTGAWEGAGWVAGANSGIDLVGRGDTNLWSWTNSTSNYKLDLAAANFGSGSADISMSAGDAISVTATGSTLALVCGGEGSFIADGALLLESLGGDLSIKTSGAYLTQEGVFSTSGSQGLDRGWCFVMSNTDDEVISADAANMAGLPPLGVSNATTGPGTSCKATMLHGACVDFQIAEAYALGWAFFAVIGDWANGDKFTINGIDFTAAAAEDTDAQEFKLDTANAVTTAQSLTDCINAAKTAAANINVRARIDGSGNNDGKVYLQVLTAATNNYPLTVTVVTGGAGTVSDATIGAGGVDGTQVGTIPSPGTLLYLSSTAQGIYSGNGQATETCPSASGDSVIRVGVITNDTPKADATTPPQHPDVFSCRWMPQFIANRP